MECSICLRDGRRETLWLGIVGAGPANLGLAAMLREVDADLGGAYAVLEGSPAPSWHEGQLLPGTTLLSSFVWDLVTPVNPRSEFTFLNYLNVNGRLPQFLNAGIVRPSRREFQDYLRWTAGELGLVRYGVRVDAVGLCVRSGVFHLSATDRDGPLVVDARNVVIGIGTRPLSPFPEDGRLVVAVGRLLERLASGGRPPARVAVVGAGQSAAEAVDYCLNTLPACSVDWFCPDFAPVDIDESAFAMDLFLDEGISRYFLRDRSGGGRVPDGLTSGVDAALSKRLVQRQYEDLANGLPRLGLIPDTRIRSVEAGTTATLVSDRGVRHSPFDLVVVATGRSDPRDDAFALLDDVARKVAAAGGPDRDYAYTLGDGASNLLFIQSGNERTHSDTDRNFATAPFRNARIVTRLLDLVGGAPRWRTALPR